MYGVRDACFSAADRESSNISSLVVDGPEIDAGAPHNSTSMATAPNREHNLDS